MKLENWNEHDRRPAATRFVKNLVELSEKRTCSIMESKVIRAKKEMAILMAISIVISEIGILMLHKSKEFAAFLKKLQECQKRNREGGKKYIQ